MERIVEYKTIVHLNVESLDSHVNSMLDEGYEIYGNPYQVIDFCDDVETMDIRPVAFLAQAMVKVEYEADNDV